MKSEKGGNLVVVLGQNGIDVSEDENGGDRVDGGEVDVLDEAGVVTRMHAAKPAQLTLQLTEKRQRYQTKYLRQGKFREKHKFGKLIEFLNKKTSSNEKDLLMKYIVSQIFTKKFQNLKVKGLAAKMDKMFMRGQVHKYKNLEKI